MKFVVDRRTWYRGQGQGVYTPEDREGSLLLRMDGKRCCIGFVGQQCGVPDSVLLGRGTVSRVLYSVNGDHNLESKWPRWMWQKRTWAAICTAYAVNDNPDLTDAEREAKLKGIFQANGDEIEFVN